jgi:phosphoribosylformimino-5-aminoimidazole carboxamide ribotide isomerase
MIIYPAIDLRGGKVVRLRQGDPAQQTVFSDDPVATAQQWIEQGATWLHVVNLDGALAAANDNGAILQQIAHLNVAVQFGGGLRSMDDIAHAIGLGADRVVLGTVAITEPAVVTQAIMRYGTERVCVALDARGGKITTHGWQQTGSATPGEVGGEMRERGVKYALYTDVSRDGELSGVNVEATVALAQETGLRVIASGGVSTLDDLHRLAETRQIAGAVIGMALYEGRFTLYEAIAASGGFHAG